MPKMSMRIMANYFTTPKDSLPFLTMREIIQNSSSIVKLREDTQHSFHVLGKANNLEFLIMKTFTT